MLFYQLLRPFAYLTIEHPEKWKFDWLIPSILTTFSGVLFLVADDKVVIFGGSGVIPGIMGFVQILPGFYIAALAAIATFNRQDIDKYIPEPTPTMDILVGGEKNKILLTRRRFLCMLFAFLTAESIGIALLSLFSVTFSTYFASIIPPEFHFESVHIFLFCYMFLFWQMIIATGLGLYYLGDRLNQPD